MQPTGQKRPAADQARYAALDAGGFSRRDGRYRPTAQNERSPPGRLVLDLSMMPAIFPFAMALWMIAVPAFAQESDEELTKKLSNPLADLVSVPFQYTGTLNVGPLDKPQHTLNVQPVYPTKLNADWLLIHRAIVPLLSQPAFTPEQERKYGVGDIVYEGFFSPTPKPGGVTWGAGPIVQMKTATDDRLGSGQWAAGPAVVALVQPGKWSLGALLTQMWSFAGDEERAGVSQLQLQPLASYRVSPTNTIGYLGTITANWKADSGERWTVPARGELLHPDAAGRHGAGQLHPRRRLQRDPARQRRRLVRPLPGEFRLSEMSFAVEAGYKVIGF
jgi:hypothetical protein